MQPGLAAPSSEGDTRFGPGARSLGAFRYRELIRLNPDESRVKTGLDMVERNLAQLRRELERKDTER
jgi:hypothetical protein